MSRLVVIEYISLDGVVQAPGHAGEDRDGGFEHGGWTGPLMSDHSRYISESPKYVASTTLDEPRWQGTTVINSDVPGEVKKLKEQSGKPVIVVGSSQLAQTLTRHKLVDEYQLWLHPIVLGSGKRLFQDGTPVTTLRLIDSRTTGSGLVILTYGPAAGDER